MAKYSKSSKKSVGRAVGRLKEKKLTTGSGAKIRNRQQAVAAGLSEARSKGIRVPPKKNLAKSQATKKADSSRSGSSRGTEKPASAKSAHAGKISRTSSSKTAAPYKTSRKNAAPKKAAARPVRGRRR